MQRTPVSLDHTLQASLQKVVAITVATGISGIVVFVPMSLSPDSGMGLSFCRCMS